jgi:hypothetical protein
MLSQAGKHPCISPVSVNPCPPHSFRTPFRPSHPKNSFDFKALYFSLDTVKNNVQVESAVTVRWFKRLKL